MNKFKIVVMMFLITLMPVLSSANDCSTVENNNLAIHVIPMLVHETVTFDVTGSHTSLGSSIDNIRVFTGGAGFEIAGVKLGMGISHYTNGTSYGVDGGDNCVGNTALALASFFDLGDAARLKLGVGKSKDLLDSWDFDYTTFHAGLIFGF